MFYAFKEREREREAGEAGEGAGEEEEGGRGGKCSERVGLWVLIWIKVCGVVYGRANAPAPSTV